ncbi:response regulator [Streptococcus parauberis]|uniref:response regulator transcription factor n=1 Tax=Streptococcus parauberis TaxID=1348 RepID=UPI00020CBDAD|nr:response regulator transcription factor [Streptococcus parauberis]AEF25654.1 two-component response regulator [Streptococcus parauberis KCTC 11537]UWM90120.1 response regulator transcription factor [Streptococcus parauberis]GAJ61983.1 two-component response regulator [Streptococcus parauberis]
MYHVLLVDDEYMILQGLKMLIDWEHLGFQVVATAKSANQALRLLDQEHIDVLISDVNMPEMSGLDLIEKAKEINPQIQTMIISGYQEFDYVKKAMELEAKAYLLKPIDKHELEEKMRLFKNYLENITEKNNQVKVYHDHLIQSWLNDELNENDFLSLVSDLSLEASATYCVLFLQGEFGQEIPKFFESANQLLFLLRGEDKQELVAIVTGDRLSIKNFTQEVRRRISGQSLQLVMGEIVSDWENVYESYNQVKRTLFFNQQIEEGTIQVEQKVGILESELEFFSFNKALMIGDKPTIISKLDSIFKEMQELHFSPEDVKHVAFLLFSDIYRQFPILEAGLYQNILKTIHSGLTIDVIKNELITLLEVASQKKSPSQRYSDLVMETIACIEQDYEQDLSLKLVSEKLHINSVYLGQCFKNETERSFAQYLNQVRIQKAQQMLLYSNKTINEIAFATGYNTNHYFIKMFKKLNGLSPKEFRDQYKDNYQAIRN